MELEAIVILADIPAHRLIEMLLRNYPLSDGATFSPCSACGRRMARGFCPACLVAELVRRGAARQRVKDLCVHAKAVQKRALEIERQTCRT